MPLDEGAVERELLTLPLELMEAADTSSLHVSCLSMASTFAVASAILWYTSVLAAFPKPNHEPIIQTSSRVGKNEHAKKLM